MERFRSGCRALWLASCMACAAAAQAAPIDDLSADEADAGEELSLLERATPGHIAVVPEPGAMLLVGTGLLLAARHLRKTSSR